MWTTAQSAPSFYGLWRHSLSVNKMAGGMLPLQVQHVPLPQQ
ncbi:hypothetical protein B194_2660 [Serratia plymuthica A30]|nr:hypothetical protein B194_2660 [Serratia plymuthica A30]